MYEKYYFRKHLVVLVVAIALEMVLATTLTMIHAPPPPVVVKDDFGREVTISKPPERIISIAPSITEILFALGLGDKVVGVTMFCNYPPEVLKRVSEGKITIIGGYTTPSLEKIVELNPDLVIGHNLLSPDFISKLEEANIPIIIVETAKSLEGIYEDIELIGKACWADEAAKELIERIREKISLFQDYIKDVKKVDVVHICWVEPIYIAGSGTYIHDIIERAGGRNAFADKTGWAVVSKEELVEKDPPYIIVPYKHGQTLVYEGVKKMKDEGLIHGEILSVDPDIISRPGPRVTILYETLVKLLHPEIWSKVVVVEELTAPESVGIGEAITIFVKVKNPGELDGEKVVEIMVNGIRFSKRVVLKAGESRIVDFLVPASSTGTYTISAGTKSVKCKVTQSIITLISGLTTKIETIETSLHDVRGGIEDIKSRVVDSSKIVEECRDSISSLYTISMISLALSIISIILMIIVLITIRGGYRSKGKET